MNRSGYEQPIGVRVWGPWACFTRPEMKVERVSYPVMTPTAARGVLEAIFWRPEFKWMVREIWVLNEVRYFSILRNEVNSRQTEDRARGWQRAGGVDGYVASEDRTQRHTLALRSVDYVIRADVVLRPDVTDDAAKYRDQFRRRVRAGRCAWRPYLGCREFAADFAEPDGREQPWEGMNESLGQMLLDIEYGPDRSGRGTPRFFEAEMKRGVLNIPDRSPMWRTT